MIYQLTYLRKEGDYGKIHKRKDGRYNIAIPIGQYTSDKKEIRISVYEKTLSKFEEKSWSIIFG